MQQPTYLNIPQVPKEIKHWRCGRDALRPAIQSQSRPRTVPASSRRRAVMRKQYASTRRMDHGPRGPRSGRDAVFPARRECANGR